MANRDQSENSASDDLKESLKSFSVMAASAVIGVFYFFRWAWRGIEEQHPVIQTILLAPVPFVLYTLIQPIAEPIYSLFWVSQVSINGSLYLTGLPVPVSIAIYFLLVLLLTTMFSNYRTQQELENLRKRIE